MVSARVAGQLRDHIIAFGGQWQLRPGPRKEIVANDYDQDLLSPEAEARATSRTQQHGYVDIVGQDMPPGAEVAHAAEVDKPETDQPMRVLGLP